MVVLDGRDLRGGEVRLPMKLRQIAAMPTLTREVPENSHESVLRAFWILEKVKDWLRRGVPADVILELVAELEERP